MTKNSFVAEVTFNQINKHKAKYIITAFSLMYIKMNGKNINFVEKKSKKVNFTGTKKHLRQMTLMLIKYQFLKETYGTKNALKYFNGYNDNDVIRPDVIRPLCLRLPQMTGHATKFNKRRQCLLELTNNF